jgi:hypothetical protein
MEAPFLMPISAPLIVTFALMVTLAVMTQPDAEVPTLEVIFVPTLGSSEPLQGFITPLVMLKVAEAVQPAAFCTVQVYIPAEVTCVLAVLAPLLQAILVPLVVAVKVAVEVGLVHGGGVLEMETVGFAATTMVVDAVHAGLAPDETDTV